MIADILRKRMIHVAGLVVFLSASVGHGAESDPFDFIDPEGESATRFVVAGVTLGNDWSNFPTSFAPGYDPGQDLDRTLPLYVEWINDTHGPYGVVSPTVPITEYDWFQEAGGSAWEVTAIIQEAMGTLYTMCPDGQGLELPTLYSTPTELQLYGQLQIKDTHGGIGTQTVIIMSRFFQIGTNPTGGRVHLVLSWEQPGTVFDDLLSVQAHCTPGAVYHRAVRVWIGGDFVASMAPVRIIEWPSADFAGTEGQHGPSPRYVDAADMSYFFAECWGKPVRWGFSNENPPYSPTFQCDISPFTNPAAIDAADLASLFARLGDLCGLSKPGTFELAAIRDWFGLGMTGRYIAAGPNGELLPEVEVVDWEKNRRAVADPYGYRTQIQNSLGSTVPWTHVKRLYR